MLKPKRILRKRSRCFLNGRAHLLFDALSFMVVTLRIQPETFGRFATTM